MGVTQRSRLLALVAIFVTGASIPLAAEVLARPPYGLMPITSEEGAFADVVFWSRLKRFVSDVDWIGSDDHNYHYDLGSYLTVWSGEHDAVEGIFRYQFNSERPPADRSSWLFHSSVFINEVGLRYRRQIGPVTLSAHFRHDSKHELDRSSRRMAAHDSIGLEASAAHRDLFGRAAPDGFLRSTVEMKLPVYVFQELDLEADAVYRGKAALEAEVEPFRIAGRHPAFFNARVVGLLNERPDEIAGESLDEPGYYLHLDYQLRAGVRFRGLGGTALLYGELQQLSDDWVDRERITDPDFPPVRLLGFGIMLLGGA